MRIIVLCWLVLSLAFESFGQWEQVPATEVARASRYIVCPSSSVNSNTYVPPPREYLQRKNGRANSAVFEVEYIGFESQPQAQAAFQTAVDIWSSLLTSNIKIRVRATWQPLGAGVLGQANASTFYRNSDGVQRVGAWYPVALAEKIANRELNNTNEPDIEASFNSQANWSYLQTVEPGRTNFISVVLHELGHGLAINRFYSVQGGVGSNFLGTNTVYEQYLVNGSGQSVVVGFENQTTALGSQLTSNNLFFNAPLVIPVSPVPNGAKIFAPFTYSAGSSIAHLDESTFPSGSANALMTPQIGTGEVHLNPGPIINEVMREIGWTTMLFEHDELPTTEDVSQDFVVKAKIRKDGSDNYDFLTPANPANAITVTYSVNGGAPVVLPMAATGQPNEFSATIPKPAAGVLARYQYFFSVNDNLGRTLTYPGKGQFFQQPLTQFVFAFEAGPDTRAPFITHTPVPFVKASDPSFNIQAIVSDNLGVQNVFVDYKIDGGSEQTATMNLVAGTDSTYQAVISYSGLTNGDQIEYRIRAVDVASNLGAGPNTKVLPSSGFYNVNVVSLAPTQDSYANDFNNLISTDFFGSPEFSIKQESGFANGAIHTQHPYPEGTGFPNNRFEWVYQLRVPIRVKETDATIKFDEVVLIEPGEPGSVFPNADFYDFVVVDGSKDGGITWTTVAAGYDSRDYAPWLTRYTSAISGGNSTAIGDPSLFRTRVMDLQQKFDTGDEVVIRFRLFSDPGAAGWGWAIDNLKIQIDETAPVLLHDHVDFVKSGNSTAELKFKTSDPSGIKDLKLELKINNDPQQIFEYDVEPLASEYIQILNFTGLTTADQIQYRIIATDSSDNSASIPPVGFIQISVLSADNPVSTYLNDFNSATTDFTLNYFTQSQPTGFANQGIHSLHPYLVGFGTATSSNFNLIVKKPITVTTSNPYVVFDEIAVVEYSGTNVKDFVIVEASTNLGDTWVPLTSPYGALSDPQWRASFDNNGTPNSSLFRTRIVKLTDHPSITGGSTVHVRFRIFSDAVKAGWGWAIDNLSIQGPITGLPESVLADHLLVYPNPVRDEGVSIDFSLPDLTSVQIQIVNAQGQAVLSEDVRDLNGSFKRTYATAGWADGMYLVRLQTDRGQVVRKVVKIR